MQEQKKAPEGSHTEGAVQRCIISACGAVHGLRERIYACPCCGGPLEIEIQCKAAENVDSLRERWRARAASTDPRDQSGVWRFRELLSFADDAPVVSLAEGNTPLYDAPRCAHYCGLRALRLKHQGRNPTGSFKDTGMTTAVTQAVLLGARTVACASTGNTAASLAAYAARAGLQCAVLVPEGQISAAKLAQSMDYGAVVMEIAGNFDAAMRVIQELTDDDSIYIANSLNPFRIEGQKTVAFELAEQCAWQVPDHVVVPGGNMGNSSALGKGFEEMLRIGLIHRLPKLSIIQAEGAAPLAHLFSRLDTTRLANGAVLPDSIAPVERPQTLATAIRIGSPVSWKKALRAVLQSKGQVIAVSEEEIADAKAMIGRDGIGCEPASAATVAGIRNLVASGHIQPEESVVAILTGHLLKDPDYAAHYHRGTLSLPCDSEKGPATQRLITGAFRNSPDRVAPTKNAVLERLHRSH